MSRNWTFGQKIAGGFGVVVVLAVLIGAVAIYALRTVVASKDRVITTNAQNLIDAERLNGDSDQAVASARGFLLTGDQRYLERLQQARADADSAVDRLKRNVTSEDERRLIDGFVRAQTAHGDAMDHVIGLRRSGTTADAIAKFLEEQALPKREALRAAIGDFVSQEQRLLEEGQKAATETAASATKAMIAIALLIALAAGVIAAFLTRTLGRQIGTAINHVQSSSSELQAAANQQATGAKEQATAMNEITTTITELLATSRQIAESAQRVAHIAGETVTSARTGEDTVQGTQESVTGIRRQVDLIVHHMLDLGKRSQQIGAVLEIVSELAEQTNILAINATIEAAGAGEAGARFAVVADEIRKLADRVGGSTKEIRGLIEDVRGAVNTTVMATESGSKAVDAGSRKFGEVAASFKQIAGLVATTTEAAREIELSTKQQATAVEQVNVAIANVAQATRETEASSSQTLQTASQLSNLSRELVRLIQSQPAA